MGIEAFKCKWYHLKKIRNTVRRKLRVVLFKKVQQNYGILPLIYEGSHLCGSMCTNESKLLYDWITQLGFYCWDLLSHCLQHCSSPTKQGLGAGTWRHTPKPIGQESSHPLMITTGELMKESQVCLGLSFESNPKVIGLFSCTSVFSFVCLTWLA